MARYQIILAYDGTQFVGSQRQEQSRTVQSVLEHALKQLGWEGRSILLAGRTDTGVHASGQVAAVDLEWQHSEEELLKALNSNLPRDMAVHTVRIAADRFHPRFDAVSRHYRYRLYIQPNRDPLRERFYGRMWPEGDRSRIITAAELLKGTHDFAAFGSSPRAGGSTMRTVSSAKWEFSGDVWTFDVQADAFLYRMVRRMVFTQTAVAQGKITLDQFRKAILEQSNLPAGLAAPSGLTLVDVKYDMDELK